MRLIQIAEHYWWEIDGTLALTGAAELTRLPFRRFLLAVMQWARPNTLGMKQEDAEQALENFDAWMFSPLSGTDPDRVTQEVIDDEMAAFKAFSKQTGGAK